MTFQFYCGIDVSKLSLDIVILDSSGQLLLQDRTANHSAAFHHFLTAHQDQWPLDQILFCLEPTGHYSNICQAVLLEQQAHVWMANPADIQRSIGMQRGKNDKIDAQRIASYSLRFQDKARFVKLEQAHLQGLSQLLAYRQQLVCDRAKYKSQSADFKDFISEKTMSFIQKYSRKIIKQIEEALLEIDRQIEAFIRQSDTLSPQYELIMTVPGVGKVLAQTLIAYTAGFTRFTSARALACHAGVAPFTYTSGTSIRSRSRVSHRANKRLKSLFHMASLSVIRCDGELKTYFLRKVAEGKAKMSVLNAIRNKIISRIFSVLKRGIAYQKNYVLS